MKTEEEKTKNQMRWQHALHEALLQYKYVALKLATQIHSEYDRRKHKFTIWGIFYIQMTE